MADPHEWRDKAACHGADVELFFPYTKLGRIPQAGRPDNPQIAEAKAYCQRCDVVSECLEDAIVRGDFGIRGGMTEDERRLLREQLKMATTRREAVV